MDSLFKWHKSLTRRQQLIVNCCLAIMLTLTFVVGFNAVFHKTALDHPFIFSLFPVVISAFVFGYRSGFASLIATTLYTDYYLISPPNSLKILGSEVGSDLGFMLMGLIVIWLIKQQRNAQANLATTNAKLEQSLVRRESELKELQKAHDELSQDRSERALTVAQLTESNRRITAILEKILRDSQT